MKRFLIVAVILLSWIMAVACRDDGNGSAADADTEADSGTDADTGSNSDTDAGTDAHLPYDFEAAAPWYECPEEEFLADATVVTAFDQVYQYFGDEDFRTVEAEVEFPGTSDWVQVGLMFHLECPENGLCDHWDRAGSVQLVLNPEATAEDREYLELARHITPYKMEMCQYIDVTPLAPLLNGTKTLTSFIDTWVGPGHTDGEGWRVTVKIVFYPGENTKPSQVFNIFGQHSVTVGEVEPEVNVDSQIDPVTVSIPADATSVLAHVTTTGHSFGNTGNCAEFCQMRQDVIVNGTVHSVNPWRDDCESNPVSPQFGTWQYGRNGWCPGAISVGRQIDVTDSIQFGADNTIDFDILMADGTEYDNIAPVDLLPYELIALRLYVY